MFLTQLKNYQEKINKALVFYLPREQSRVLQAATYSLLAPGKRLRPILLLSFYQALAAKAPSREVTRVAVSLEYAHTFSLIHDDLPGIDNDNLRRGQPTCHTKFDEATAILAGDYLYGYALENLSKAKLPPELKVNLINDLAAGMRGVINGEMLDILGEGQNYDQKMLQQTFALKTASLFQTAFIMASRLANDDSPKTLHLANSLGAYFGLAFQIQDDILGVIGQQDKLGKSVGLDAAADKSTWVKLHGLPTAQIDCQHFYSLARQELKKLPLSVSREFLSELFLFLQNRDS